jgi:hypothetical protein
VNAREEQSRRSRSPLSWVLGCLIAFVIISGILALLYWPRALQGIRGARELVGEVQLVRSAVSAAYDAEEVSVNRKYSSKVDGPYLSIEVLDSESLRGLTGQAAKAKALEIATLARDSLGNRADYGHFEVIISTSLATTLVRDSEDFLFKASELPAAPIGDSQ